MQAAFGSSVLTHKKEQQIKQEDNTSLRQAAMKRSAVGLLLFYKEKSEENENMKTYKIAVAGTGYVGLAIGKLHHTVMI